MTCAGAIGAPVAQADILRCGSVLVESGASAAFVIEKCGQPTSKTKVTEPVWARGVNGNVYQTGDTEAELWRYNFGPNKFPAVLRIVEGLVESITFEKSRG